MRPSRAEPGTSPASGGAGEGAGARGAGASCPRVEEREPRPLLASAATGARCPVLPADPLPRRPEVDAANSTLQQGQLVWA